MRLPYNELSLLRKLEVNAESAIRPDKYAWSQLRPLGKVGRVIWIAFCLAVFVLGFLVWREYPTPAG